MEKKRYKKVIIVAPPLMNQFRTQDMFAQLLAENYILYEIDLDRSLTNLFHIFGVARDFRCLVFVVLID